MSEPGIGTYPVGFFRAVRILSNRLRYPSRYYSRRRAVLSFVKWFGRSWRRRGYWVGFRAEWRFCPQGVRYRPGWGWSRRAALRRLGWHIVTMNLAEKPR